MIATVSVAAGTHGVVEAARVLANGLLEARVVVTSSHVELGASSPLDIGVGSEAFDTFTPSTPLVRLPGVAWIVPHGPLVGSPPIVDGRATTVRRL